MATYYEALNVPSSASPEEIHEAYRYLAQKFHPDANPANPEAGRRHFQAVQAAFETLSDDAKRGAYDLRLLTGDDGPWEPFPMDQGKGGLQFNSNGSLKVGSREIPVGGEVKSFQSGGATVEKDFGIDGELRVFQNGGVRRFRYVRGRWYSRREKPTANGAPSTQPSAVGSTAAPPMAERPAAQAGSLIAVPPKRRLLTPISIGLVLLLLGAGGGYVASRSGDGELVLTAEEKAKQQQAELRRREELFEVERRLEAQTAREDQARREKASREERARLELALTRDRLLEVKRRGEAAIASVDSLLSEIKQWEEEIPPLLNNADGRKLATTERNIRGMKGLLEKRRSSQSEAAALRSEIDALLEPIKLSLEAESSTYRPAADMDARLKAKGDEAERLASDIRSDRLKVLNLVKLSTAVSGSSKTLAEALEEISLADAKREAEQLALVERERRAAAAAEAVKTRQALVAAQAEKERLAVEAEVEATREQAQREKDIKEAQSARVKKSLRFFITPGYYQPLGNAAEKGIEPRPVSFSKLQAAGALEPNPTGMQRLLAFQSNYTDDVRTRSFEYNYLPGLPAEETKRLKQIQDDLNRLGPVLVELKMLDP